MMHPCILSTEYPGPRHLYMDIMRTYIVKYAKDDEQKNERNAKNKMQKYCWNKTLYCSHYKE